MIFVASRCVSHHAACSHTTMCIFKIVCIHICTGTAFVYLILSIKELALSSRTCMCCVYASVSVFRVVHVLNVSHMSVAISAMAKNAKT